MPKPRKVTQETWYDIWAEWPAVDRAAAIKVLEATHRQLCKVEARTAQPKTDAVAGAASIRIDEKTGLQVGELFGNKAEE